MKIQITKSGGFAGLSEDLLNMNTAMVDKDIVSKVEKNVYNIRFFDLPEYIPSTGAGSDLFIYKVTVSDNIRQHQINFYDDKSPDTKPYLEFVNNLLALSGQ